MNWTWSQEIKSILRFADVNLQCKSYGPLRTTPRVCSCMVFWWGLPWSGLLHDLLHHSPHPLLCSFCIIYPGLLLASQHHVLSHLCDINHATPLSFFVNVIVRSVGSEILEHSISYLTSPYHMQYDLEQVSLASGYLLSHLLNRNGDGVKWWSNKCTHFKGLLWGLNVLTHTSI